MSNDQVELTTISRRQELHANIARACPHCGAPGYWHSVEGVNMGCYDPEKEAAAKAAHQGFAPVGKICPQCGGERPDVEARGRIWSKTFRGPTLSERVKGLISDAVAGVVSWRFK